MECLNIPCTRIPFNKTRGSFQLRDPDCSIAALCEVLVVPRACGRCDIWKEGSRGEDLDLSHSVHPFQVHVDILCTFEHLVPVASVSYRPEQFCFDVAANVCHLRDKHERWMMWVLGADPAGAVQLRKTFPREKIILRVCVCVCVCVCVGASQLLSDPGSGLGGGPPWSTPTSVVRQVQGVNEQEASNCAHNTVETS